MPEQWGSFISHLWSYLGMVYDVSYVPIWNFVKTAACGWIATSILRFQREDGMNFKFKATLSATVVFMLCIMELSRVVTGVSTGVSPFVSLLLLMFAQRLHHAKGNISNVRLA